MKTVTIDPYEKPSSSEEEGLLQNTLHKQTTQQAKDAAMGLLSIDA